FEQDALVVPPGVLIKPNRDLPPFALDQLQPLDWLGINIRKESQGPERDPLTVQARTIREILDREDWEIVMDDDGSGEIADIVAVRHADRKLNILLVHCKYSSQDIPGGRVSDLYEVCGQAQKSAKWRRNIPQMFHHLIRREKHRSQQSIPRE